MRKLLVALGGLFLCLSAQAQSGTGTVTTSGADCTTVAACANDKISIVDTGNVTIQVTGTWSATLQFEASSDGGATFVAISGAPLGSTVAVTSATANGTWRFNAAGITDIRVRASAMASGTAAISFRSSKADPTPVGQPATTTSGTASAITQAGYPIMCDSATSGTVTAGQAQMVRCTTAGILATQASAALGDATSNTVSEAVNADGNPRIGASALFVLNGATTWDRLRGDVKGLNVHGTSLGITCQVAVSTATTLSAVGGSCAAPGASTSIYITDIEFGSSAASGTAADSFPTLKSGTGGTCGTATAVIWQALTAANTTQEVHLQTPIKVAVNSEVCWIMSTAGSKTINISGYLAP